MFVLVDRHGRPLGLPSYTSRREARQLARSLSTVVGRVRAIKETEQ